jgi:hypothetical protein
VGLFAFIELLKKKEVIYLIFVGIKILYKDWRRRMSKLLELVLICLVLVIILSILKQPGLEDFVQLHDWGLVYTVEKGDTLWNIAADIESEFDIRLVVAAIKEVNKIESLIYEDQRIILPKN